jgi:hypothetical protein
MLQRLANLQTSRHIRSISIKDAPYYTLFICAFQPALNHPRTFRIDLATFTNGGSAPRDSIHFRLSQLGQEPYAPIRIRLITVLTSNSQGQSRNTVTPVRRLHRYVSEHPKYSLNLANKCSGKPDGSSLSQTH